MPLPHDTTGRLHGLLTLFALCALAGAADAQTSPAPAPGPAPSSGTAPPAAAAPAPARPPAAGGAPAARPPGAAAPAQRIEITGERNNETEQRRQATASKIVIGREEIDKFGDSTIGEVLRRLPGVTTPGPPGRGGPPRMRGLGGGFTQLLIDGQRVPPGFSLESLTPEMVESIEVLRAPTAETGARAIAGTINIITRGGFRRRLNDLRLGLGHENGRTGGGINWSHNDTADDLTYTLGASLFAPRNQNESTSSTQVSDTASGALLEDRTSQSVNRSERIGVNLNARLQWRLGEGSGDSISLMPMLIHTTADNRTRFSTEQRVRRPGAPQLADSGSSDGENSFTNARLGLQYRQRIGNVRWEANGNVGTFRADNESRRVEFTSGNATPLRTVDDNSRTRESSANLTLKGSMLTAGNEQGGGQHSLVGGAEVEVVRRDENRVNLQNGRPQLAGFGDDLEASSTRLAAFVQDEWSINPNWSAHAGLRWEGIDTRGDSGEPGAARPENRSSVWTPLLHAVWKPDPKSRNQVRASLTRSYRSPQLGNLIARPSISALYDPTLGPNIETAPDRAGNPGLKPELATGIDIAIERYLEAGGVLSANLFHRQISNLIRNQTVLENSVSWSAFPRWVSRPQNIGDATTSGLELEARFRLDQLVKDAPRVEVRSNLSLFTSRVKSVPGPDNRLEQQARATGNIGADYRLRGTPFTLGGNVNWVPGYTTRTDADQTVAVNTKLQWDAYALYTFNPAAALRVLTSNLAPRDFNTTTVNDSGNERTRVVSGNPSYLNLQVRLELKL